MRSPEALLRVDNVYKKDGKTTLELPKLSYFDRVQYDLIDPKGFKRYISDIENMVRNSFEYKWFIEELKTNHGMNQCSFFENVSSEDGSRKVRIEIHHEPFTLYDIVMTVYKKRQAMGQDIRPAFVANEVMWLHYMGFVALIPLSYTIHQMVHNSYLFIPMDKVRGSYKTFRDMYYDWIDPETLDMLDCCEQYTLDYNHELATQILNRHDIYLNIDGSINLPKKDDIVKMIKGRIEAIKNPTTRMCTIVR